VEWVADPLCRLRQFPPKIYVLLWPTCIACTAPMLLPRQRQMQTLNDGQSLFVANCACCHGGGAGQRTSSRCPSSTTDKFNLRSQRKERAGTF